MSAIYGIINLDGKALEKEPLLKMEQEYRGFKIDRFSSILHENAAFGTGLQFITKQSHNEILPFLDRTNNNLFTADSYLDNRKELIPLLTEEGQSIGVSVDEKIPDGMLIYLSYLKWGQKLCDHLLGIFAIAIYDYNKKEFHLYVDHCGDRCVHYYLQNNTLYFSTIIRPIHAATGFNIDVSEKYIAACESNLSPDMVIYPGMTPFQELYQILAGQHLTAYIKDDKTHMNIKRYYDPIADVRPLKLSNDADYQKLFLDTYSKCVSDALDVDGNVGAFLSSGLDSSSVATLAALNLKKAGKELHTYTSVPIKSFIQSNNSHRLEDETVPVQKFCECFDNIVPTFVSCEGKSALTELERFVNLFDSPIKYGINAIWIEEIYKTASQDGCKVILKGQHGNASVSYGGLITRLFSEFKRLHYVTMIRQYKTFTHTIRVNKKAFLKAVGSEFISIIHPDVSFKEALTKPELIIKYNLKKEYRKRRKQFGCENIHSELQRRNMIYMPASFQQVAYAHAHFELEYGIIARDPTRDKRIIELCMAMPASCFADGAYERRLITYYMRDLLPKHIHRQIYRRGLQSADYIHRIKENSLDIEEKKKCFSDKRLSYYINNEKLEKLCFDLKDDNNVVESLYVLALYYFLNNLERNKI